MRDDMREAIGETVQGLVSLGLPITFTEKQLGELGVVTLDSSPAAGDDKVYEWTSAGIH